APWHIDRIADVRICSSDETRLSFSDRSAWSRTESAWSRSGTVHLSVARTQAATASPHERPVKLEPPRLSRLQYSLERREAGMLRDRMAAIASVCVVSIITSGTPPVFG